MTLTIDEKKINLARLDLRSIRDRLIASTDGYGHYSAVVRESELEYRRFLLLASQFDGVLPREGSFVDLIWREHQESGSYQNDCHTAVGVAPVRTGPARPDLDEVYAAMFDRRRPVHWQTANPHSIIFSRVED
jgi:hypothetical protein